MGRFEVEVGEEFEVEAVEAETNNEVENNSEASETKHRMMLSLLVLGFAATSVFVACLISFHEGEYTKVQTVYNVAIIPVTAILSFYFRAQPSH